VICSSQLQWVRGQVHAAVGGTYQTLINTALREDVERGESRSRRRSRTQPLLSGSKRVPPVEQEWVRLDGRILPVEVTAARVPLGQQ
jgi:hypothetical protein